MIQSVAKISQSLADELIGTTYDDKGYFNPVTDLNGNTVISLKTAQYLTAEQYEIIDWQPPLVEEEI